MYISKMHRLNIFAILFQEIIHWVLAISYVVPGVGVEPTNPFGSRILSPLRKPFRHPGIKFNCLNFMGARNNCLFLADDLAERPREALKIAQGFTEGELP